MNLFRKNQFVYIFFVISILLIFSCGQTNLQRQNSKSNGTQTIKEDTCANPDASINCYFLNMPESLTSVMNIADSKEPGDRLIISGTVFKSDGKTPYPELIMYAYHTNNTGNYSKKGNEKGIQKWHGYLHGWCKTDSLGHYEIHSIRPARYPGNTDPAHIHAAIKESNGSEPFYINDFVFKDDNLVDQKYISTERNIGGSGVVGISKNEDGIWVGHRNIILNK